MCTCSGIGSWPVMYMYIVLYVSTCTCMCICFMKSSILLGVGLLCVSLLVFNHTTFVYTLTCMRLYVYNTLLK